MINKQQSQGLGYEEARRLGSGTMSLSDASVYNGLPKGTYGSPHKTNDNSNARDKARNILRKQSFGRGDSLGVEERVRRVLDALELERITERGEI